MRSTFAAIATIVAFACGGGAVAQVFRQGDLAATNGWQSWEIAQKAGVAGLRIDDPRLLDAVDRYIDARRQLRDQRTRPLQAAIHEIVENRRGRVWQIEKLLPDDDETRTREERIAEVQADHVSRMTPILRDVRRLIEAGLRLDAELILAIRTVADDPSELDELDIALRWQERLGYCSMIEMIGHAHGPAWTPPPIRPPESLRDPAIRRAFTARLREWHEVSIQMLRNLWHDMLRAFERGDDPQTTRRAEIQLLEQQIRAIDDLADILPADMRETWRTQARNRLLGMTFLRRIPVDSLARSLADRMSDAIRTRIEGWYASRRPLEDAMLRASVLQDGRADALQDQGRRLDEVEMSIVQRMAGIESWPAIPREELELPEREVPEYRQIEEFVEPLDSSDNPLGGVRLEFAHCDRCGYPNSTLTGPIAEALGVQQDDRALWDALCHDLLEDTDSLLQLPNRSWKAVSTHLQDESHEGSSSGQGEPDPSSEDPGLQIRQAVTLPDMLHDHAELENRWFDSIAAAFPHIPRSAIEAQRSRRELERLVWLVGRVLGGGASIHDFRRDASHLGQYDIGLISVDRIIDALPSADRDAFEGVRDAVRSDQVRMFQECAQQIATAAAEAAGWLDTQPDETSEPDLLRRAQIDFVNRYHAEVQSLDEHVREESMQRLDAEVDTIRNSLPPGAERSFRREIQNMRYPLMAAIIRDGEARIKSALRSTALTPRSLMAIARIAEDYRIRSESIFDAYVRECEDGGTFESAKCEYADSIKSQIYECRLSMLHRPADLLADQTECWAWLLRHLSAAIDASKTPERADGTRIDPVQREDAR